MAENKVNPSEKCYTKFGAALYLVNSEDFQKNIQTLEDAELPIAMPKPSPNGSVAMAVLANDPEELSIKVTLHKNEFAGNINLAKKRSMLSPKIENSENLDQVREKAQALKLELVEGKAKIDQFANSNDEDHGLRWTA